MPYVAIRRHGRVFSRAMSPATIGHPNDAHHAQSKERRHESPTAADTPGAVPHPHANRTRESVAPRPEKQAERAAALRVCDELMP